MSKDFFYENNDKLAGLIKEYARSTNRTHFHITTLPKKTEAGNPDFRI